MKRRTNRWEEYCETTYNSLRANVHNWGRPEFFRPLTRIYYMGVFDCGNPNHTRLISETAYSAISRLVERLCMTIICHHSLLVA